MPCNPLIHPDFDYAASDLKEKIQIAQKKIIHFCLKLDKRHYTFSKEFESINWLPVYKSVHQCMNAATFKFVNNAYPYYLNKFYKYVSQCSIKSKSSRFFFGKVR